MEVREIVNRLRDLEITGAELNRAQENLLQERDLLLTELERTNLEEERQAAATRLGEPIGSSRRESSARGAVVNPYLRTPGAADTSAASPVVNPYRRNMTASVGASTQQTRPPRTRSSASPVVNPYTQPTPVSREASRPTSIRPPRTTRNASGRKIRLSDQSGGDVFHVGDRVEITNDLYKTLRRATFDNDYVGRVIDVTACTVLIHTDRGEQVRRHHSNVEKIQGHE